MKIPYQQRLEDLAKASENDEHSLILLLTAYVKGVSDRMDLAHQFEEIVVNSCDHWGERSNLAKGIKNLVQAQGHYYGARFDKVIPTVEKAVDLLKEQGYSELEGSAHMIWGGALRSIGEVDEAVSHLMKASEQIAPEGSFGIYNGYSHYQLAEIYVDIKDYESAEKNYHLTAHAAAITSGTTLLFRSLNGLGNLYLAQKKYPEAYDYFTRSMDKANVPTHISRALCDLGNYYLVLNDPKKAQENYKKSYEIRIESGLEDAASTSLIGWSKSCLIDKDYKQALELISKALSITFAFNAKNKTVQCYKILSDIYAALEDWKNAYEYRIKHDQLQNEITSLKLQNIYKLKNKKIEEQKRSIEEAHKEITDSINYAKRIQEAIMPSMDAMHAALGESFVLYLPKDVVAGDFFWMEALAGQEENDDVVYYAAADCTGHGVPGAMVSVVCSNALTKALLEEGIRDTGKLLDRTRELVIAQLAKSGEEVKDGMDISLCRLNQKSENGNQNVELQWSGANNPLWILRGGAAEFEEIKADKQPIGKYEGPKPFTSYNIELKEGDTIYVFTDGYQDQFGGPKGKKFKAKQLKQLILDNRDKSMVEQKELLFGKFRKWQGDQEQVDDVCVIGVRV